MDCGNLSLSSPFDCLMFDLDDTLYSSDTGIAVATKKNIEDFLMERLRFGRQQAKTVRVELFKTYGSALAGLRALGYEIDADDYHRTIAESHIYTNSDRIHATKVLNLLGLEDCFEQLICFQTLNPNISKAARPEQIPVLFKPSLDAMRVAISAANVDPNRTLFLDDSERNIAAGKLMGLKTALVGSSTRTMEADYAVESVNNLVEAIPEIWMISGTIGDDKNTIGTSTSDLENLLTVGA